MRRLKDILFITFFLLMLVVPYAMKVFDINTDTGNTEKRILKPLPLFKLDHSYNANGAWNLFRAFNKDLSNYKQSYDEYYRDNFRLKNNLFDIYVAVKKDILHSRPIPSKVVEGRDGWLYLGNSYCDIMLEYTALKVFKLEELTQIQEKLEYNAHWMAARGIRFYVVVAPDKQNIYGEYLPLSKRPRPNKFEQMKQHNSRNGYELVDLHEALLKHKNVRLFTKTDTHWNEYGAFWGYTHVMHRLAADFKDLTVLEEGNFKIDTTISYTKDLSQMLRLKIKEIEPVLTFLRPEMGFKTASVLPIPERYNTNSGSYEIRFRNPTKKLKILFFRDSFSGVWMKFFKESFGESVFISDWKIDRAVIEKEHPDIVIYEVVERDIDNINIPDY